MSDQLQLTAVRRIFRLIGEIRELGNDAHRWRPHMIRRLQKLLDAEIVVSSEIHVIKSSTGNAMRVIDVGWGCGADQHVWQIQTDRQATEPESIWMLAGATPEPLAGHPQLIPVKPTKSLYGGKGFVLSQCALPHLGAVDQLGLHRAASDRPFTLAEQRLVRLFHVEMARLWRLDALRRAKDPAADLPPRLTQTLQALLEGLSEKQIAGRLELSPHTIHNYIKALHQRFEVSSRGELLAKAGKIRATFLPQLSVPRSDNSG